jgi:glutathione S-transferase
MKINSGLPPHDPATGNKRKYTVPTIHHVPSNKYLMDSLPIAQFLESTYPDPPVPLSSELGNEIMLKLRSLVGPVMNKSLMPREALILAPRAAEYFRRTREAPLGHPLEDLLVGEEQRWEAVDTDRNTIGALIRTNKAEGPFILGARPSYADFFIAGSLQSARVIDEGVFQRSVKYPGHREIYEACQPFMERKGY